jgi:hypothetical protein
MDILSEKSNRQLEVCAVRVATETCHSEIQYLIQPNTGFHFQGTTACLPQLENFSISQMAKKIMETALNLWHLLGVLLEHKKTIGDMKRWASTEIIWRKYMMIVYLCVLMCHYVQLNLVIY